jgi:plasmid stability protein
MATQSVTVELPDAIYEQLRQRAAQSHRSIEAELVQVVSSVIPAPGKLTPDLRDLLEQMQFLDNTALWRAARSHLPKKAQTQLQSLNYKRQREGLNEAEALKANELLRQYERTVLIRAQAISLLKERGQDISEFEAKE